MMPVIDGVETCRMLRENPDLDDTFIMFLTARSEEYSEVAAFDIGADTSFCAGNSITLDATGSGDVNTTTMVLKEQPQCSINGYRPLPSYPNFPFK